MINRYKKKGGFVQLLQLIETASEKKQSQFLSLVASESPAWEKEIRKKILSIDKIYNSSPQFLVEILTRLPALTLASALHGKSSQDIEKILSCMPPISKRKIEDAIIELKPTSAEKLTSEGKIISEVRSMADRGIVKLDKIDPDLLIEENIEELLKAQEEGVVIKNQESIIENRVHQKPGPESVDTEAVVDSTGVSLKFPEPTVSNHNGVEVEQMKKKIIQLINEVNALKHENAALKTKLLNIKKIA